MAEILEAEIQRDFGDRFLGPQHKFYGSGYHCVVGKSAGRPVLDRHIGQHVSGIMRGETISWTIGRQRGLGIS
ncbi:MAG: DUF3363 domain-containing protein [Gammaproteobacteria bacterium]|nr:DUF3363 domain-containing protein [Gammaproteobacteria bacterium]